MLKFQAVAEKTAKNFRGLLFFRTLYIRSFYLSCFESCVFFMQVNLHVASR